RPRPGDARGRYCPARARPRRRHAPTGPRRLPRRAQEAHLPTAPTGPRPRRAFDPTGLRLRDWPDSTPRDVHPLAAGPGGRERGVDHPHVGQPLLARRAGRAVLEESERVLVHLLGLLPRTGAELRRQHRAVAGAALVALVALARTEHVPAALAVALQRVEVAAEAGHAPGHDVLGELEPEADRLVDALEQV